MKLYGINNCDTVRKARKWLNEANIPYTFHDFRKDGLSSEKLSQWEASLGWEALINRRGTTWRQLPQEVRDGMTAESAHRIMLDNPAIIKRPVSEHTTGTRIGFNAGEWAQFLQGEAVL
ncbi:ArsC family reductase [Marinobacter sp. X15-166B]|uniref:ArsC family reductase n=1 Tax=Marinobacter sp. X15-166B TaxID=1897620 RepID=UPI00085C9DED|nr:ArsC family reductase [Marinobacter sp. X15-166B]OEY67022.1 arsenate reductase [Marinobacter sp. X15-166B]